MYPPLINPPEDSIQIFLLCFLMKVPSPRALSRQKWCR